MVEICETDGYPIVYGEKIIDSKAYQLFLFMAIMMCNQQTH
jgi:hypothetical protein